MLEGKRKSRNSVAQQILRDYLTCTSFEEEKIVAITCDGTIHFSNLRLPNKTIYISHQNDHNYADLLNGALYEFDFDPTESEILLYNTNKLLSPLQRMLNSQLTFFTSLDIRYNSTACNIHWKKICPCIIIRL